MSRSSSKFAAVVAAAVATVAVAAYFLKSGERPVAAPQPEAKVSALPLPSAQAPDPQALPASAAVLAASSAPSLPESRQQRIERLASSAKPEERWEAYQAIYGCAMMQRDTADLVRSKPSDAPKLNQEMNQACDGLSATLMSQRFKLVEALAKEKFPGAAVAYFNEAPDGTPAHLAKKDGNHQVWHDQAVKYLDDAAKSGDRLAVDAAGMMFIQEPGREYDAVLYKVAGLEVSKRQSPNSAAMYDQLIAKYTKDVVTKSGLDAQRVQQAASAGRTLAKSVNF